MNFHRISAGVSLSLVAVAVLAHALAPVMGGLDRTAVADGARAGAPDPVGPKRDRTSTGGAPVAPATGAADGCVDEGSFAWFGAIRDLPPCAGVGTGFGQAEIEWARLPVEEGRLVDVNGDGAREAFRQKEESAGIFPIPLVQSGQPAMPECVLMLQEVENEAGAVSFREHCVLDSAVVIAYLLAQEWAAGSTWASGDVMGWRDLDGDRDLDLVIRVQYFTPTGDGSRGLWLENTGFEATRPLAGDLDGDGNVNSADLTMLLGGWTGN